MVGEGAGFAGEAPTLHCVATGLAGGGLGGTLGFGFVGGEGGLVVRQVDSCGGGASVVLLHEVSGDDRPSLAVLGPTVDHLTCHLPGRVQTVEQEAHQGVVGDDDAHGAELLLEVEESLDEGGNTWESRLGGIGEGFQQCTGTGHRGVHVEGTKPLVQGTSTFDAVSLCSDVLGEGHQDHVVEGGVSNSPGGLCSSFSINCGCGEGPIEDGLEPEPSSEGALSPSLE
jgi:hypothetical protein